jgi:hypothetical protein
VDPDPHHFGDLYPHSVPRQLKIRIRIRIRIRINLQMTRQQVWNMSLFEHCFKGLSLYLEARIWIRIRIRVKVGSGSASNKNQNPDPYQGDYSNLDPHQGDADPQH